MVLFFNCHFHLPNFGATSTRKNSTWVNYLTFLACTGRQKLNFSKFYLWLRVNRPFETGSETSILVISSTRTTLTRNWLKTNAFVLICRISVVHMLRQNLDNAIFSQLLRKCQFWMCARMCARTRKVPKNEIGCDFWHIMNYLPNFSIKSIRKLIFRVQQRICVNCTTRQKIPIDTFSSSD